MKPGVWLLVLLLASAARGRTISSPENGFVVSAPDSATAQALLVAVEDVADRLNRLLRLTPNRSGRLPIYLSTRNDEQQTTGRIVVHIGRTDSGYFRHLEIINPERVDQGDLLEALTETLLHRSIAPYEPQTDVAVVRIPAWFSVGIAQNLFDYLRAQNARLVAQSWKKGDFPSARQLLDLEYMPPGRWREKAFCGVLCQALLSAGVAPALLREFGNAKSVSPADLAAQLTGSAEERDLEKYWELWLARLASTTLAVEEPLRELEERLRLRPEIWVLPNQAATIANLTWEDLIPRRKEPWVRRMISHTRAELTRPLPSNPDLLRVAKAYDVFLQELMRSSGGFRFLRARREARLRRLLAKARKLHEEYRNRVGASEPAEDEATPTAQPFELEIPQSI